MRASEMVDSLVSWYKLRRLSVTVRKSLESAMVDDVVVNCR